MFKVSSSEKLLFVVFRNHSLKLRFPENKIFNPQTAARCKILNGTCDADVCLDPLDLTKPWSASEISATKECSIQSFNQQAWARERID
jgi:hypothetical protein